MRGISVLIERDQPLGVIFLIQSRAVEKVNEDALKAILRESDFPVSWVVQTGLVFCPWCGANLENFYAKRVDELARPGFSISLGPAGCP